MDKHAVVRRIVCSGFILAVLFYFSSVALAQTPEPAISPQPNPTATLTPSPAATATLAPDAQPANRFTTSGELLILVLLTGLIAAGAWGILFLYVYRIQGRYFDAARDLAGQGFATAPSAIGSALITAATAKSLAPGPIPSGAKLVITGPARLLLGTISEYKASIEPASNTSLDDLEWKVIPDDAAIVQAPGKGASARIIALKAGEFRIRAELAQSPPAEIQVSAAPAAQTNRVDLPTFTQGYGAIAILLAVLAVVVILGLAGTISRDALVSIITSVAGFALGVQFGRSNSGASSGSDQKPTAGG